MAKQDVGAAGNAEKEKSQASDSFKRACFNWGIGRELYTAPFIWIPAEKAGIRKQGERFCSSEHFSVASISYNSGREIDGLAVVNRNGQTVFQTGQKAETAEGGKQHRLSAGQMESLNAELKRTGVGMEDVRNRYRFSSLEEMSAEMYDRVMTALAKTKSAKAA